MKAEKETLVLGVGNLLLKDEEAETMCRFVRLS